MIKQKKEVDKKKIYCATYTSQRFTPIKKKINY